MASAAEATPQVAAVLQVVDDYIREQTAEGAPYYIDSSATEFVGFEEDVRRQEDSASCTARFASGRDTYYLRFVLSREMGRYVIHRVVLERLNDRSIRRTLFNRDTLVL